jgi:hypothetical protein
MSEYVDYLKEFEQCAGTYLKVIRFHEPSHPDGFVVLYLRPGGRFLFLGYWEGYERSVAAGRWSKNESEFQLEGRGRGSGCCPPGHQGRFSRTLKLALIHHTPMLTATTEQREWSLLSWVGPFMYVGEQTVINPDGEWLPDSLAVVDQWIDEWL